MCPVKLACSELSAADESRALLQSFAASDVFRITLAVNSTSSMYDAMRSGKARVAIRIPTDYAGNLLNHTTASVLVLVDGSDSSIAAVLPRTQLYHSCQLLHTDSARHRHPRRHLRRPLASGPCTHLDGLRCHPSCRARVRPPEHRLTGLLRPALIALALAPPDCSSPHVPKCSDKDVSGRAG
jgi:hypothetical protein